LRGSGRGELGLCDHQDMRPRIHAVTFPAEIGDFGDEIRLVFLELGRVFGSESLAGECSPAVDVFETDESIEITVDLPGVDPAAVRVVGKGDSILIAGEKKARRGHSESSFHLVERGYGHFARVIRLARASDTSKARATLRDGELRISISKIKDRRSTAIPIQILTKG
jgi:HSP20 family protein